MHAAVYGRARTLFSATFVVFLVGCGDPPRFPVEGRVEFRDGVPVQSGRIEFRSETTDARAMGEIGSEGQFHLTAADGAAGLPAGDYQVIVVQLIVTEDLTLEAHEHGAGHGRKVPRRYADYYTSDLRATVTADGSQDLLMTLDP